MPTAVAESDFVQEFFTTRCRTSAIFVKIGAMRVILKGVNELLPLRSKGVKKRIEVLYLIMSRNIEFREN